MLRSVFPLILQACIRDRALGFKYPTENGTIGWIHQIPETLILSEPESRKKCFSFYFHCQIIRLHYSLYRHIRL